MWLSFQHKFSSSAWHHWTTQQVNPHFTTSHSFAHLITDAISIHSAQQCQVTLPLDYTCTAPVIRALVYSMVGPGWASCCEELNFHFPSSQVCVLWSGFSVLLKIFPSPYVLVFEPGGTITAASKLGSLMFQFLLHSPGCPSWCSAKAFFLLIWQWEGPKSKSHLQDYRGRKSWWLDLIVFQMGVSNVMVELQ